MSLILLFYIFLNSRSRARAKLGYDPSSSAGELEQEHQSDAKKLGFGGGVEGEEVDSITNEAGHVNFFQNLENGEKMTEVKYILADLIPENIIKLSIRLNFLYNFLYSTITTK